MRCLELLLLLVSASCAGAPVSTAKVQHLGPVTGMAFGETLFSCSQAGLVRGVDAAEAVLHLAPEFRCLDVVACRDGILLCGGEPGQSGVVAWLPHRGNPVQVKISDDLVYRVALATDGKWAAAGCADGRVWLMRLPNLQHRTQVFRHTAACRGVAFAKNTLCSVGLDGLLALSPATVLAAQPRIINDHTAGIECLAVSADGRLCATGSLDGKVRLHRVTTDNRERPLLRTWQRLGATVRAVALGSDKDAALLVGLADGRLLVGSLAGNGLQTRASFAAPISALCVAPGGEVYVGLRGVVRVTSLDGQ